MSEKNEKIAAPVKELPWKQGLKPVQD